MERATEKKWATECVQRSPTILKRHFPYSNALNSEYVSVTVDSVFFFSHTSRCNCYEYEYCCLLYPADCCMMYVCRATQLLIHLFVFGFSFAGHIAHFSNHAVDRFVLFFVYWNFSSACYTLHFHLFIYIFIDCITHSLLHWCTENTFIVFTFCSPLGNGKMNTANAFSISLLFFFCCSSETTFVTWRDHDWFAHLYFILIHNCKPLQSKRHHSIDGLIDRFVDCVSHLHLTQINRQLLPFYYFKYLLVHIPHRSWLSFDHYLHSPRFNVQFWIQTHFRIQT